jgi:single-stranded-DNA-specific exonuclease
VKDSTSKNSQNGIAFRKGQYNSHLKNGGKADICYTMEENTFNGNTSLQLMIKDIRNNQQQEE